MMGARTAIAGSLMIMAIVAVIFVVDQDVTKESTVPQTSFVKTQMDDVLTHKENVMAKAAGAEADRLEAKEIANKAKLKAQEWAVEQKDALKDYEADMVKLKIDRGQYGSNCLTLKAYSIALYDDQDPPTSGEVNELLPILKGMQTGRHKDNTKEGCARKFYNLMKKLTTDQAVQEEDSIAKGMLKLINVQMLHKRGILVWGKLSDREAHCTDETDQRDCGKIAAKMGASQWVYLDAARVGYTGEPGIFSQMAVGSGDVIYAANNMRMDSRQMTVHEHHTVTFKFSSKDTRFILDWDGK